MLTGPIYPPAETTLLELVGTNEQVDQGDFGASVSFNLPGNEPAAGVLTGFTFISSEEGSGSIQTLSGHLLIFDADPGHSAGDVGTGISTAEWQTLIAVVTVETVDWTTETTAAYYNARDFEPIRFHAVNTLYFVWRHTGDTSYNDAAGDDEVLDVNVWYQRLS